MLRREGWRDNHKRIYRLYSEQGLSLRLKRPRRNKSAQRRQPQPQGLYPNHVWGMDFVSDALFDGRRLRLLTVIDLYTRECLGICVGQNLRSTEVAEMLNSIALRRPLPQLLKTDNGSEFAGKMLDRWVYERGIQNRLLTPGNTDGQCDGGVLQRQVTAGMPERKLVHVPGGCTVQNRGLAHTL